MVTSRTRPTKKITKVKPSFSFRRSILPPLVGVFVVFGVLGLLNLQQMVAQFRYHFTAVPTVRMTVPKTDVTRIDPKQPPQIVIPKIGVQAPVIFDVTSTDDYPVQLALQRGTLRYGNAANPGEKGNVVIVGHSSGAVWRPGQYKFVFTLLDKLEPKDIVVVDYQGTRYSYEVTSKQVVEPTDGSVLRQTASPELTLITCTPVGTNKQRLVVHARQISPNPATAKAPRVTLPTALNTGRLPQ